MLKVILPNSWDYGEAVTAEVKMATRGLFGADYQALVKRAGEETAYFLKHCPDLDQRHQLPVHVIAMGSTEGFGCFAAGTPFAMADGGYLPIEDVQKGDLALSADGNACEVSHLFRRHVPESVKIDVCGLADELHCSLEHPFRVARYEQFTCQHDKYKRCLPPLQGLQNICNRPIHFTRECVTNPFPDITTDWATAESLRVGDFLVWTAPKLQPAWDMCRAEGYLLGAWLAEGSFTRNTSNNAVSGIQLSLHANETEFRSYLSAACGLLELNPVRTYKYADGKDPNSARVVVSGDPERFRRWHDTFRAGCLYTVIPPWVCCLPRDVRLAIVAGYLDGDGSCTVDEKENRTTARSHGRELSLGFQRLCWSLGMPAVRCPVHAGQAGWNVSIANSYLGDLAPLSWKVRGRELKQTSKIHGFYHEGRMYLPVRGVAAAGPVEVFNVEIEGDHTYSGPNVDSHNCNRNGDGFKEAALRKYSPTFEKFAKVYRNHKNKPSDTSYGQVKKAYYNERMRRTELLLLLNRTKEGAEKYGGRVADEELETLESGESLPVSMSCKIAYDVCSVCDNKAKDRSEYCESVDQGGSCPGFGCKYGLTKVSADGHVQHVDNPHPIFFDISSVYRPADRIAYGNVADYLLKAAASAGYVGGAKLAEAWGVSASDEVPDLLGVVPPHIQTLLTKLARVEQNSAAWRPLAPFFSYQEVPFQRNIFGAPGTKLAESSLAELTRRQICLSADQFLGWLGADNEKIAAVKELLPGVFLRLSKDPELASAVPAYSKQATEMRTLVRFETMLGLGNLAAQAFTKANLQKNAAASVFSKRAHALKEPKLVVSHLSFTKSAAGQLAGVYLGYVLDFLAQQPQSEDLPLTMQLVVAQNHR